MLHEHTHKYCVFERTRRTWVLLRRQEELKLEEAGRADAAPPAGRFSWGTFDEAERCDRRVQTVV